MAHLKLKYLKILRETEKAFLFVGEDIEDLKRNKSCNCNGWLPKSHIVHLQLRSRHVTISDWLCREMGASKDMLKQRSVGRFAILAERLVTPSLPEDMQLQFIVNGWVTSVMASPEVSLYEAAQKALKQCERSIDLHTQVVTDEKGNELPTGSSPLELQLRDGALVFVSPPAGVGG